MIDIKIRGRGAVTPELLEGLVEAMGAIINERFEEQEAEIKRLRTNLDAERRIRLGMRK
jgi:hypothetical protein